jgi:hypothetical protein
MPLVLTTKIDLGFALSPSLVAAAVSHSHTASAGWPRVTTTMRI